MIVQIRINTDRTNAGQSAPEYQVHYALNKISRAFEITGWDGCTDIQVLDDSNGQPIGVFQIIDNPQDAKEL